MKTTLSTILVAVMVSACSAQGSPAPSIVAPATPPTKDIAATRVPHMTTPPVPTAPDEQPWVVRLAAVGDTGTGSGDQDAVARLIASRDESADYDGLLLLGDLVYPRGEAALVESVVLAPYADTLDGSTQLMPVLGNHDVASGEQGEILASVGIERPWYHIQVGEVLIIVVDSTQPDNAQQLAWLTTQLADVDARWTIVAMHHPAYSAGVHGSDMGVREAFVPLLEASGVDLVLAGHDHDYQRSIPINGITYIVSGNGSMLRPTGSDAFTAVAASALGYLDITITHDELVGSAVGLDGVIDSFTIPYTESNRR